MLKITNTNGLTTYVPIQLVESITEAGTSSQWHGIRSIIKTTKGNTYECRETAESMQAAYDKEMQS